MLFTLLLPIYCQFSPLTLKWYRSSCTSSNHWIVSLSHFLYLKMTIQVSSLDIHLDGIFSTWPSNLTLFFFKNQSIPLQFDFKSFIDITVSLYIDLWGKYILLIIIPLSVANPINLCPLFHACYVFLLLVRSNFLVLF